MSASAQEDLHCCVVCNATEGEDGGALLKCSRCKCASYCCRDHQKADWKFHKTWCYAVETNSPPNWWEKECKCRKCGKTHARKRSCYFKNCPTPPENHYGVPELIIWPGNDDGIPTGWGNIQKDKSAALKKRFEEELGCDEEKLAKIRPQAFRWTCCGMTLDVPYQCDHHGSGPRPCTCDFCSGGMAIPHSMRKKKVGNYGLKVSWGPDPRSYDPAVGGFNLFMNQMMAGDFDKR